MSDSESTQILSRLSDAEFVGRESEVSRVCGLAKALPTRAGSVALLLGRRLAGKSEILRKSYDRLFAETGDVLPVFYSVRESHLDPEKFASDYFAQFVGQMLAFRRNDPSLLQIAYEPFSAITRAAPSEDYIWIKSLADSFLQASRSRDASLPVRCALSAPAQGASRAGLIPLVMIDNWHLIADGEIRAEFLNQFSGQRDITYVFSGLSRLLTKLLPPSEDLLNRFEVIHVGRISEEYTEKLIRRQAELLGIEISDSTIELMIQQLERNLFYTRSILDAAASGGSSLKTFMEFERTYVAEVLSGRINHYLGTLIREVAKESRNERAVFEALNLLAEAAAPVPIDRVTEHVAKHTHDPQALLARMHARELLKLSYGFVSASDDPVLADYVRAKYRKEIAGVSRPVAGEELLGEKLKHSHNLMMSRYNRATRSQLIELVSHFDFQNVPATLFHHADYDKRYRGMSRVQVRRALDEEPERVRLPQIVTVHELASHEESGVGLRLFAATGFEGGIYTDSNEVVWMIALINSKEALDDETLARIEQRLDAAVRDRRAKFGSPTRFLHWYVSKEGFSAQASERLSGLDAYSSTYSHLDLIQDHLTSLASCGKPRPASEFELVIPVEDEAELIAARTAEQIARAADFDAESINQIKTALIEACINAAEHGDAPDRKIHQHFAIDENKLIITVTNKGKTFGRESGQSTPSVATHPVKGTRGRGLQIIRALMDDVSFERTDDGARLVMTKHLKRPENQ